MAVETTLNKRRRVDDQPTAANSENSARYSLNCILSAQSYRQARGCISSSIQSVVVVASPKPNATDISAIAGDYYASSLGQGEGVKLNKVPLRLAEQYHGQNTITHLEWNQRGTTLATIDETGKIGLWELGVRRKREKKRLNPFCI